MNDPEIERIEIELLLQAIHLRYGYDFREYAKESIHRRLEQFIRDSSIASYSDVTARLLRDPEFFRVLLPYFSVSVTALFRDPFFYAAVGERVIPRLRAWPHVKIWHAGCATGEEVYSFAVLLREAGLLERSQVYGTDISQAALETAKAGIYPLEVLRRGSQNYLEAGCRGSLADHYLAHRDAAIVDLSLRRRVTFARHNLAMDASFGEMQVIVCRNVLIYFNEGLQNQVLELFWESLENGGMLCLGDKESLTFSSVADRFQVLDEKAKIFRKIAA